MLAHFIDGPAHAPALVLLHPIATHSAIWLPQVGPWSAFFRVVRIDLAGHGASASVAPPNDLAGYASQVWEVFESNGLTRAAVVGVSFGGMVAQAMALQRPEFASALVLAHTSAKTGDNVRSVWDQRLAHAAQAGMPEHSGQTMERWFTAGFRRTAPRTVEWVRRMVSETSLRAYEGAVRAIQRLDHLDRLDRIGVPVLLLAGEHDTAIPLDITTAMARRMPSAQVQAIASAHLGSVEQPTAFLEHVGNFLGEHS
jgi:3-oxoadipate enol-lactonase